MSRRTDLEAMAFGAQWLHHEPEVRAYRGKLQKRTTKVRHVWASHSDGTAVPDGLVPLVDAEGMLVALVPDRDGAPETLARLLTLFGDEQICTAAARLLAAMDQD